MRKLLLLRPEPGLSASAARARAQGLEIIACPLFRVEPVSWAAPDAANYDGLLLTSANAVRHGGGQLDALKSLPVHAVGEATAEAARNAGLHVETIGGGDVIDLLGKLPAGLRLLHLAGEDRREHQDARVERRTVYRSMAVEHPALPPIDGLAVAIHSPRAGTRFAGLVRRRERTAIAAISAAAAEACGEGWERVEVAVKPDDNSLLALAAMLCHTSPPE